MFHVCWEPKPGYCYNRVAVNFSSRKAAEVEAAYVQDENPGCGSVWIDPAPAWEKHRWADWPVRN